MCKFLPFSHFYGLVIVPVLAMMLALPASAQNNSSSETQGTKSETQGSETQGTKSETQGSETQGTKSETQGTGAILINIDKSKQRMTVSLDGVKKYVWPVSTGQARYSTPSGTYTATSMNEIWYSKEWDNAPMPHSIFFRKDGYAIHGTYEAKNLGRPASHGCVRISRENAATLYALVKKVGLKNTEVVLAGVTPGGEHKVARSAGPRYGQARAGRSESNNYYAQPQWGGGFFGSSYGGSYYNGSQGYYRPPPPRSY
jgi:L,D-transpeptidase catalytic domain